MLVKLLLILPLALIVDVVFTYYALKYRAMKRTKTDIIFELEGGDL
jgi:hypothetical protein